MSSVSSITAGDYLNSLTSSGTTTTTEEEDDGSTINQDEFLEILVTQLEYQDPLNPMDTEQFTSQLTDFSMLEQQIETNEILGGITDTLGVTVQSSILNYIGKEVVTSDNLITVDGDDISDVSVTLSDDANVQMLVYNSDGDVVRQINCGDLDAGIHDISWDGTDENGDAVDDGDYIYLVSALDDSGSSVDMITAETGIVSGVYYDSDSGTTYLEVGGNAVSLDSVTEIKGQD